LASDLRDLRGVGPRLESSLNQLGIHTTQDLLFHLPLRYEDRTRIHAIGGLYPGARVLVEGEVEHSAIVRGRRSMLVVVISDGTGRITLRFFHFRAAQKQQLSKGTRLRCYGEVRGGYQGLDMVHPSYKRILSEQDRAVSDRLTPVYPTVEGLGQASWIKLSEQALTLLQSQELELEELLPDDLRGNLRIPPLADALAYIHRPPAGADVAALVERRHPAQQRLALEELLAHNLSMQQLHRRQRQYRAPALSLAPELEHRFIERLPFKLTGAQERVITEIQADLAQQHPMQRLVQGDVGSGKTVVAAMAALRTMGNGYQAAVMAPTELLAEQHLRSFTQWLAPLGIEPVWLSGKVTGKTRQTALEAIEGSAPLVIGTHALMQEGVRFGKLGLVVVDEQHRFGVHQRLALLDKAGAKSLHAHQLIMTATPIPRTLAMTAYAGLETSVIDELPPGRKPVITAAISNERRNEVVSRAAAACSGGKQAYWVCTLIEESGVDIPNASLMIIENAERLGLAQLHQLRGRVGRGDQQASCVLLYSPPIGLLAKERLNILRETSDGFRIAEKDLELRGPGEVLGTRQTGMLQFRVADLARDRKLLESIPAVAERLLTENPDRVDKLIRRWIGDAARFAIV
jgi:ATP-dependent DNA helicase RecG